MPHPAVEPQQHVGGVGVPADHGAARCDEVVGLVAVIEPVPHRRAGRAAVRDEPGPRLRALGHARAEPHRTAEGRPRRVGGVGVARTEKVRNSSTASAATSASTAQLVRTASATSQWWTAASCTWWRVMNATSCCSGAQVQQAASWSAARSTSTRRRAPDSNAARSSSGSAGREGRCSSSVRCRGSSEGVPRRSWSRTSARRSGATPGRRRPVGAVPDARGQVPAGRLRQRGAVVLDGGQALLGGEQGRRGHVRGRPTGGDREPRPERRGRRRSPWRRSRRGRAPRDGVGEVHRDPGGDEAASGRAPRPSVSAPSATSREPNIRTM